MNQLTHCSTHTHTHSLAAKSILCIISQLASVNQQTVHWTNSKTQTIHVVADLTVLTVCRMMST